FLSTIDAQATIDRYNACETNFRTALNDIGIKQPAAALAPQPVARAHEAA
ncbi:MAG TPA: polysaccharide pyruvyl transferase family protein, partial [Kaistia sp.]|nr:polysaccharide pyruvyl transferase family protein [Kaistia sp.]